MLIITKADARRPGALCEVIGETATRYDVTVLSDTALPLSVEGGHRGTAHYVVKSRGIDYADVTAGQYEDYLARWLGIF